MAYRLLAIDLDGTLLRRDHTIDPRDIAAIGELQDAGVTVTIATGRLHSGALGPARACAIDGVIACCEGSHLIEVASDRTLQHHGMSDELSTLVSGTFRDHALTSFVFHASGIDHEASGEPYAKYISTWSPNMRLTAQELTWQAPLAAIAVGELDAITAAHARLAGHAQLFSVSFGIWSVPGKHAIMVRRAGLSKGTALAELCQLAGCTLDEAVVVGDWLNDVPMFEVAGRSFAMGSAPDALRAKATATLDTLAGTGGGIAEAIARTWG